MYKKRKGKIIFRVKLKNQQEEFIIQEVISDKQRQQSGEVQKNLNRRLMMKKNKCMF
ncbi:unnamed protein product [Paramecium sonneborni]|uniref:Uncharacterized protein n=1 Tax=Paramecium sonneborni TaxID=65129 RepID=A0A8S1KIA8_9CILI|nr:unnamed protein product [Paramecium sonneborni]